MLGREAYHRPMLLAEVSAASGGDAPDRMAMLERMTAYARREMARGERLSWITRHMLGLYSGMPGAKEFRRQLSEGARDPDAPAELLLAAGEACERLVALSVGLRGPVLMNWCQSARQARRLRAQPNPGAHALKDILPMIPGELISDYRIRLALEQVHADERHRARAMSELTATTNAPDARIRAWERTHGLSLPRERRPPGVECRGCRDAPDARAGSRRTAPTDRRRCRRRQSTA